MKTAQLAVFCLAVLIAGPTLMAEGASRQLQQSGGFTSISTGGSASARVGARGASRTSITLESSASTDGPVSSGSTEITAIVTKNGGKGCPAGCTDKSPSQEFSCPEQKKFGKCDKPWMISGYFCGCTCGRCDQPRPESSCEDVLPPSKLWTCQQQAEFGKCDADWMIKGGYCKSTCDRCDK